MLTVENSAGQTRQIHEVELAGYLKAGWAQVNKPQPVEGPSIYPSSAYLTLYKGNESIEVHRIDASAYLALGWSQEKPSTQEPSIEETGEEESNSFPLPDRETQLREMLAEGNWREVAKIAKNLGIVKPEGGWDEAVPLIIAAESESSSA